MKRVLIAGGTGMIGQALVAMLRDDQCSITLLSTRTGAAKQTGDDVRTLFWNPGSRLTDEGVRGEYDAVINLAGHTINCRWTSSNRQKILTSRIDSTTFLTELIASGAIHTPLYISSGAIGIYSNSNQMKAESHPVGDDFLGQVCRQWEKASEVLEQSSCRRVIFRLPVVLSASGGMLSTLKPTIRLLGGVVTGSGRQHMSFVHVSDVASAMIFTIKNPQIRGVYNLAAPEIPTAQEFTEELCDALGRKVILSRTPAAPFRWLLGERAGLILDDQQIDSSAIRSLGYSFLFPTLESALSDIFPH